MRKQNFQQFTDEFINQIGDKVVSITEFGSDRGEEHPRLSDIDLFIIAKKKSDIKEIFRIARLLEKKYLRTTHSKLTNFLQRHLLVSNDFCGIHLIILSQQELGQNFELKSLRLKMITTVFISKAILAFNFKHKHRLLYGEDLAEEIIQPVLRNQDRITPFVIPSLVLLTLPLIFTRHKQFEIWCFKALKYHGEDILAFSQIYLHNPALQLEDLKIHYLMLDLAKVYRYHPERYRGTNFVLYFKCWACLFSNLAYLWRGPVVNKNRR